MTDGLLYQIDGNLFAEAQRAAEAYTRRTGHQAELCHAHPKTAAKMGAEVAGMDVVADKLISPICLLIGQRATEDGMTNNNCSWIYDETHDKYDTNCGQAWQLTAGTPATNRMRYCPYCGWDIEVDACSVAVDVECPDCPYGYECCFRPGYLPHQENGWCINHRPESGCCLQWQQRPAECREYVCPTMESFVTG